LGSKFVVATGAIADLDDESFSPEAAKKGLWSPLAFIEKYGVGVYFLEKYDPDKIPVLFINGIGGSPRDWKPFFKRMDRKKYQPWFLFYASGGRIEKAAAALNSILKRMRTKYQFNSMYVVAHSMGGLVARQFIKNSFDAGDKYIKLFVSISTPWLGDKDAEWSIGAPLVIPCWLDLRPSSDFIKNGSSKDLGSQIPYYLLFSYRGDRKPFRLNNDNVVYLSSELSLDMQQRAEKVYGFNLSHSTILSSDKVLNTCIDIFAKYDE
jgi:pimeloyl-ACP methyl ester carboxylesterase